MAIDAAVARMYGGAAASVVAVDEVIAVLPTAVVTVDEVVAALPTTVVAVDEVVAALPMTVVAVDEIGRRGGRARTQRQR